MHVAAGVLELNMRLRTLPGHVPTRVRVWFVWYLRGFVAGLAIFGGLIVTLVWSPGRPPPRDNLALTILDTRGRDAPYESYRLDGTVVVPWWHTSLPGGTRVSATTTRYLAREDSVLAIGRGEFGTRGFIGTEHPLREFHLECHLIVHRSPDRTELATCLSPVVRP
jgi:hypothetical protein